MNRVIFVAHVSGLVDYKGESLSDFGEPLRYLEGGFDCEYSGDSDEPVWPSSSYVDTTPEILITDITCSDPSFFYDASKGFISVKSGVQMSITATISNFPIATSWNTPLLRNGSLEGYIATSSDGVGNVVFDATFPQTGLWEITEEAINRGLSEEEKFRFPTGITAKVST